jgi:hypothetical protein
MGFFNKMALSLFCLFSTACGPYFYKAEALCIEQAPNIKVTKRFDGAMMNGEKVHLASMGIPLESILYGNGYSITFHTPVTIQKAFVYITAASASTLPITLKSDDLRELGINPWKTNERTYDDFGHGTSSGRIAFSVFDANGLFLGKEVVKYKVKRIGYVWGIDTI